jgi:DNA polymerase-3 subunit gamma/tau
MRDALSILDQVLAYSSNELSADDTLSIFSLESKQEKVQLLKLISQGNTGETLKRIKGYIEKGTDIRRLSNDILLILKDVLVYKTTRSFEYLEMIDESEAQNLSKLIDLTKCNAYIDKMMEAEKDYKNVPSINPLFEITILKMTSMVNKDSSLVEKVIVPQKPVQAKTEIIKEKEEIIKPRVVENHSFKQAESSINDEEKNNEAIQPTLFDVVYDESKINSSVLTPKHIAINEGAHFLNEEQIMEIMVLSKKDIKNQLLDNWDKLSSLNLHPELGKKVSLLVDAHPLVATKEILIIEEDLLSKSEKVNQVSSQAELQKIVQVVFKKRMFVYALTRKESVTLQQKFINLKQVGKLPKVDSINLDFNGK